MSLKLAPAVSLVALLTLCSVSAYSQTSTLRVATWNVSNYSSGRVDAIRNAVYGSFQGRSFRPDVVMAQEMGSATAANNFLNALNWSGGYTDWRVAFGTPLNGPSGTNDTAFFYRSSRVTFLGSSLVAPSGGVNGQPRDTWRFDAQIVGNAASSEILAFYNSHMKSGDGSDDVARRLIEANNIRNNANSLASNYQIVFGADTNTQSSNQSAYQALVGSQSQNRGRFFDPISSPGSWNNNSNFRFLHTQDPSGTGGMDDRHDQILLGGGLVDGVGTDYVGAFGTAFSTTTWNDLNHSYRTWGNDGTSFNDSLAISGNQMVGSSIARSLVDVATINGGHLPVFLDLRYQVVPEPFTMSVLGLGVLALARRRRKK
ncbi:MAG: PEP-CTERM sorting domain-containing protein [Fimbriimonadaceae bacterium]|jgi:hypothetical protein|nr:PEP-CTERM sorting domain-containing protein [Fimbriimonadaceae bacterium]